MAVLGATGSIGRSTLAVIGRHPDRFRAVALTARSSARELDRLARELDPELAVLAEDPPGSFEPAWEGEWRFGPEAVAAAAEAPGAEIVVNGLVGVAGLEPTVRALRAGRRLALANKESLVAGGELVLEALRRGGGELIPVDSEHSAVHQCLDGRPADDVRRILLTASGGPFREVPAERFPELGPEDALDHPTWEMGPKITVDSATLANKALEVIEAHHLFGLAYDDIDVVVHPQSVVHAMVELRDGSVLAQVGEPDMELPILHALAHPDRPDDGSEPFDPVAAGPLTFEEPRRSDFPMLDLGEAAGRRGGPAPAVYNAANEVAVEAFLAGELDFPGIPAVVETCLERHGDGPVESLDYVWAADDAAREAAARAVRERGPGNGAGP